MDATWYYALSFSSFLTIALWHILHGRKTNKLKVQLPTTAVFIALGVLSLKYIDVLPLEYVAWFKYPTIIMCLVGGMSMLMSAPTQKNANQAGADEVTRKGRY